MSIYLFYSSFIPFVPDRPGVLLLTHTRKSKLRKPETITLGKEYAGSKISREALEAESDDDPFRARSSDEESSEDEDEKEEEGEDDESGEDEDEDEDEYEEDIDGVEEEEEEEEEESGDEDEDDEEDEESDLEASKKSAKAEVKDSKSRAAKKSRSADADESVDGMDTYESGSDEGSEDGSDESDGFDDEDDDESDLSDEDDEDDALDLDLTKSKEASDEREELRRLMATDQKTIAATISQAAKADAAKGKAVKQQRSTFDALLNTRIKLQKGLTAINDLPAAVSAAKEAAGGSLDLDEEAIRSAESAALALWSTLEELRHALADAQAKAKDPSKKRKRPPPISPATASSASLWKRMTDLESESLAHRRAILDKWSHKVRGTSASLANARGKLLGSASAQQTITAVLDAHIASEISGERAAKRSRRENQQSNGTSNGTSAAENINEPIYDDTIFYQTLLRDLVEQRMSSSDAITNGVDALHIQIPKSSSSSRAGTITGPFIHPITGMRKDKVKRDVDTKASKGRKMRYNVHEKLQNFMAPEDRGTWTKRAREEFFASLLGKTASGLLGEDSSEDEGVNGASDSDEEREEGGLRLFRSQ